MSPKAYPPHEKKLVLENITDLEDRLKNQKQAKKKKNRQKNTPRYGGIIFKPSTQEVEAEAGGGESLCV